MDELQKPEETKAVLKEVETTLTAYSTKIETRVKALITEGTSEGNEKVKGLSEDLKKVNNSLTQVQQQIKTLGVGLPGLSEELKKKSFSWTSLIRGIHDEMNPNVESKKAWEDGGFEKEIIVEYAKVRSNNATDGSAGAYLIPPEVSNELIELVFAATPLLDKLPITKLSGLRGDLPVPKITGRPTAYWVGENSKPTESSATYAELIGRPRRLAAFTKQSQRLIYQSRGVSDSIIKQELSRAMALKLHDGLLNGTGSEYQPKGLLKYTGEMTSSGLDLGTNGGRFTMTDAELMKMALDVADELNDSPSNYGFLFRPEIKYGIITERIKQFSGQNAKRGAPVVSGKGLLTEADLNNILGKWATSTQIAKANSKGASSTLTDVIYGNWKYFWLMMWEGLRIKVSDQAADGSGGSAFLQNQLYIVAEQDVDVMVTRPSSFTFTNEGETVPTNWS